MEIVLQSQENINPLRKSVELNVFWGQLIFLSDDLFINVGMFMDQNIFFK